MSLTIENLKVTLQKQEILPHISLDIREGEFISLLGVSGCGKTTLLKSIAGLLEISGGDIRIQGVSVLEVPPEKRGTVIVFQDLRLFPHMTAEGNIAFPMELQKVPKDVRKERVKGLLKEVQLSGFENRKIREMSGGQMQRLITNPDFVILDEPFSGLDESLRMEMGNLVRKLHRERGITTILVTHDKREALQMSDRIALMSGGRILQFDTPENMFRHPVSKEAAEYFGRTNYVRGKAENRRFKSEVFETEVNLENGTYDAMIRPFFVKLKKDGDWEILNISFMGETAEVSVKTSQGVFLSHMMSRELERMGVRVRDRAGIEIEESEAVWFQEEE